MVEDDGGNEAYASYIESELKAERERKASLDTRGGALVTSSGALLSVLAGVSAIGRVSSASVPDLVPPLLVLALICFAAAAILGIATQWNREYPVTHIDALKRLVDEEWGEVKPKAERTVATAHLATLGSMRESNGNKELQLRIGYMCQTGAIAFVAPVAFLLIASR